MKTNRCLWVPDWLYNLVTDLHEKTGLPKIIIVDLLYSDVKRNPIKARNKILRLYRKEIEFWEKMKEHEELYRYMGYVIRYQDGKKKFEQNLARLLDKTIPFEMRQRILSLMKKHGINVKLTDDYLVMNRIYEQIKKEV